MRFHEVMVYYNYNITMISALTGVGRAGVRLWKVKDRIPYYKQCILEVETAGKLKARREDA